MRFLTQVPPIPQPDDAIVRIGAQKYVAVIGGGTDWSAYVGATDWSDEQVARKGRTVEPHLAELIFPDVAQTGRWYRL